MDIKVRWVYYDLLANKGTLYLSGGNRMIEYTGEDGHRLNDPISSCDYDRLYVLYGIFEDETKE